MQLNQKLLTRIRLQMKVHNIEQKPTKSLDISFDISQNNQKVTEIIIKKGELSDLSWVLEIQKNGWKDICRESLGITKEDVDYLFENNFEKNPHKNFAVACICQKIVGVICIGMDGEIHGFFVESSYRKKGIGGKLLDFVIPEVKNTFGEIRVGSLVKNTEATKFYKNYGFVGIDIRKVSLDLENKKCFAEEEILILPESNGLQVTKAGIGDIAAIMKVKYNAMKSSFCKEYGIDEKELYEECVSQAKYERYVEYFKTTTYFVGKINNKIVAVAALGYDPVIRTVWVEPEFQNQGIGKKLFKHLLNEAFVKFDILTLETGHQDNDRAIVFYKKFGFRETGKSGKFRLTPNQKIELDLIEFELNKKNYAKSSNFPKITNCQIAGTKNRPNQP